MPIRIKNAGGFRRALRDFANRKTPEEVQKFQRIIALDLLRRIVFRTPVDTGRARGNWQTTVGNAGSQAVDTVDPSGNAVLSAGAAAIASARPFSVITIYNNVKYIRKLEDGGSKQSPRGMVKVSVAESNAQFG